jgi:hypothetical protein
MGYYVILKWLVMKGHEDIYCIHLVRGRAVVTPIMSLVIL